MYPSLTTGPDGFGLMSYLEVLDFEPPSGFIRFVKCVDATCSNAVTVGTLGEGSISAIAKGADGFGLVAYIQPLDAHDSQLGVAHCTDAACFHPTPEPVERIGEQGLDVSLTIGGDGLGLIAYYDAIHADLKVAHCGNPTCTP